MTTLYWSVYITVALIAESFPISSSGHLVLLSRFMGNASGSFISAYDHLLHGPIALGVAFFFYPRWRFLLHPWRARHIIVKLIVLGCITESITTLFYLIFSQFSISRFPLSLGFCITAALLYSLRWCPKKTTRSFDWRSALMLGCVQSLALLPGISRFGATFVTARWLSFSAQKAFDLSFLLLVPLAAAGFARGMWALRTGILIQELLNPVLLLVILGASGGFYLGLIAVQALIRTNRLWVVAWYVGAVAFIAWMV